MFSYVSLEQRVPADHPLRAVRKLTDAVLLTLSPELDALYATSGRPSVAPEYILRALLLQVFYSVRSDRLLVEQIDYNLQFRWLVGLGMDDAVWNHAVFSRNRDRLLTSEVAQRFFAEVNRQARKFMSDEHFTVDGTLIQAWASQKSFRSKDGPDDDDGTDFRGQKRSNDTHQSSTDPDARFYKKSYGKESKLSYLGHALSWPCPGREPQRADCRGHGYVAFELSNCRGVVLECPLKGNATYVISGEDWYDAISLTKAEVRAEWRHWKIVHSQKWLRNLKQSLPRIGYVFRRSSAIRTNSSRAAASPRRFPPLLNEAPAGCQRPPGCRP
jgi:transposase